MSFDPLGMEIVANGREASAPRRRIVAIALSGLPRLSGKLSPVTVWNYLQLLGGSVVRLALSLVYFLALTRSLDLADFGTFASAVVVGVVLSRLAAFGYGANLLQIAAARPRLLGPYLGIYGLWLLASLPVCFALACMVYAVAFDTPGCLGPYLLVIASETVVWRAIDTVSIVNSGLGRFGRATAALNIGIAGRAVGSAAFLALGYHDLNLWSHFYLLANIGALAVVCLAVMPRVRPRYRRGTVLLRWRNALALGGAGLAASAQIELDKLLVFTFGGPVTAGLYAICIRVIEFTAVPIRAFNVLMIQRLLKNPGSFRGWRVWCRTELAVAFVATAAYAALIEVVHLWPAALGHDIDRAAGLFGLLWAVPALRNLTEYQSELLYANGRMVATLWVAVLLLAVKTGLMAWIFARMGQDLAWVMPMNGVFLATYLLSAFVTYRHLAATGPKPAVQKA